MGRLLQILSCKIKMALNYLVTFGISDASLRSNLIFIYGNCFSISSDLLNLISILQWCDFFLVLNCREDVFLDGFPDCICVRFLTKISDWITIDWRFDDWKRKQNLYLEWIALHCELSKYNHFFNFTKIANQQWIISFCS